MSRKYLRGLVSFLLVVPLAAFGQTSDTLPTRTDTAAASTPAPHMKSPVAAALISVVVPGGGQMYAGKGRKGGTLLSLFLIGAGTTAGLVAADLNNCFRLFQPSSCDYSTSIAVAGIATLGVWGYSIFAAPGDATEYNKRHRKLALQIRPTIQLGRADKFGRSPNIFGLRVELPVGP